MTNSTIDRKNYRKNLAKKLNENRKKRRIPIIQKSGKELAKDLLMQEKNTDNYKDSEKIKYYCLLKNKLEAKLTKKLDQTVAIQLIRYGFGEDVIKNLDKFHILDYKKIADILVDFGNGYELITNLEKFPGLDFKELAMYFIDHKKGEVLVQSKFIQNLNSKEIAVLLVENGQGRIIAKYPDSFHDLDKNTIEKSMESLKDMCELTKSAQLRQEFQKKSDGINHASRKEREKIKEKKNEEIKKKIRLVLLLGT